MSIRLVAVDIDGTLLDDDLVLCPHLMQKVSQLEVAGVGFTLATGRVFSSAALVGRELGLALPLIANGGAVVQEVTGRNLSHLVLSGELVVEALEYTRNWPAQRYLMTRDCIYAETGGAHAQAYSQRLRVPVEIAGKLEEVVEEGTTQLVIRTDQRHAGNQARCAQRRFAGRLAVQRTMPHLIEFMHQDASKGKALLRLAAALDLTPEQVMAVGDGINDLDMLEAAGMGVLVGNADPQLWKRADYVTEAHYHRGVMEALESFVNMG